MNTVFMGSFYIWHNSVEAFEKYFYAPTWHSLVSQMIKFLVDEKYINAEEHSISFSNAINFLSDGEKAWATVEGSNNEEDLINLLNDLSNDNINVPEGEGWFTYKCAGGGVIDNAWLVLTVKYNENYEDVGFNTALHTILGKSEEDLERKFANWAYTNLEVKGIHLPHNIERTQSMLNGRWYEDGDCMGLDLSYKIEDTTGKFLKGDYKCS